MSNLKLREVIKQIRQCKTAAEERGVISKESALIRNAFKSNESDNRNRNIAKLLFFNLLGYPTAFGQVECIKLVSAPSYTEKRIGYLGLSQLLDESNDILMLVTNSIKRDLNAKETHVQALGLTAIAEVSTAEMCRELYPEVKRLMKSSNPYVRQRACLAAIRTIKNIPDTIEDFVAVIDDLVRDQSQAVLMGCVTLANEICKVEPESVSSFRRHVAQLVKSLRNLLMSGYAPEYEIGGVKDPFLQVKILELLARCGTGNSDASDAMSDVLAQIATNTETSRNPGNSVLAECARTIMAIEANQGLRVLAVNILAKFLANKENNVRFVALNQLLGVVEIDFRAVSRHQQTVLDCLKDSDFVIRKQALTLLHKITTEKNVKSIVRELLSCLLATSDPEFKAELANRVCQICEQYAPTRKWHIETVVKVLTMAEHHVREEYISQIITVIATTPELYGFAIARVYSAWRDNVTQMGMAQLGCWLVGEFGQLLVDGTARDEAGEVFRVQAEDIVNTYVDVLDENDRKGARSDTIIQWALTGLSKLTIRLPGVAPKVRQLVDGYASHANPEIQQRASEYGKIFGDSWNAERTAIFEPIPFKGDENMLVSQQNRAATNEEDRLVSLGPTGSANFVATNGLSTSDPKQQLDQAQGAPLLNIDSLLSGITGSAPVEGSLSTNNPLILPQANQTSEANPSSLLDILSGPSGTSQFGGGDAHLPNSTGNGQPQMDILADILGPSTIPQSAPSLLGSVMNQTNQQTAVDNYFDILSDGTLVIELTFQRSQFNHNEHHLRAHFTNKQTSGDSTLTNLLLQVAVKDYLKLQLSQISRSELPPGSHRQVTQDMIVTNSAEGSKALALKLRVQYLLKGQQITRDKVVTNLPTNY